MNILEEVKKPLTERGWERNGIAPYRPGEVTFTKHGSGMHYSELGAHRVQALEDQPAILARIEALEAEREKIAEMRQEFLDDFSGGIICKRVREEGVYTVGNYSFRGKALDEEYDIISIIFTFTNTVFIAFIYVIIYNRF